MTITRDVITDLLPAYLSGEASADTRALVDDFLSRDPEFARVVAASREGDAMLTPSPVPSPDVERDALARTRAQIHRRAWLIAFAVLCTGMPLAFTFDEGGLGFFMLRDAPGSALLWIAAAFLWVRLAMLRRTLRGVGL